MAEAACVQFHSPSQSIFHVGYLRQPHYSTFIKAIIH
jgi:hypothetical protein